MSLFDHCRLGNLAGVQSYLNEHHISSEEWNTSLYIASDCEHVEIARFLLSHMMPHYAISWNSIIVWAGRNHELIMHVLDLVNSDPTRRIRWNTILVWELHANYKNSILDLAMKYTPYVRILEIDWVHVIDIATLRGHIAMIAYALDRCVATDAVDWDETLTCVYNSPDVMSPYVPHILRHYFAAQHIRTEYHNIRYAHILIILNNKCTTPDALIRYAPYYAEIIMKLTRDYAARAELLTAYVPRVLVGLICSYLEYE
jgi:hypothetical protein